MTDFFSRLDIFMEYRGLNDNKITVETGMSNGLIGKGRKRGGLSQDNISKILLAYPELNADWLLTGRGQMLVAPVNLDNAIVEKFKTKSTEILTKSKGKEEGKEFGKKPKVQKSLPFDEPEIIVLDSSDIELIPVVDIHAAAGAGAYNPDYVETIDTIRMPSQMLRRGKHHCIRITGDSMAPTMRDGGYVISRLLDRSEWRYMKTGYVYVVSKEGETCIKRIKNRLSERGVLICISDNPDKGRYNDITVDESSINTVWEVEWYLSSNLTNIHDAYYNRMQEMIDDIDDLKAAVEKLLQRPV